MDLQKGEKIAGVVGLEYKYGITTHGRVWSDAIRGWLKQSDNGHGYAIVNLTYDNSMQRVRKVHQLVLEAFVEPVEGCTLCNHLDGNKRNNHVDNLEWTDHSGNLKHAYKVGIRKPIRLTGKDNPFYGKKHSKESLKVMSEKRRAYKTTDEHRKKLSEAQKLAWAKRKCKHKE